MKFLCSSGKSSLKSDLLQTCAPQCTLNTVPVGRPLVTLEKPQAHVVIASQHTWKTRKRERAISLGDRLFRMLSDAQSGSQDKPAIYTHVRGRPPAQDNLQLAR